MKRLRLICIVVAVILLGGLAFEIHRAREPRYQGRMLTEWIEGGGSDGESHLSENAARNAMKHMAPEAIPILLKWAERKDSASKQRVVYFLDKHPIIPFKLKRDEEYHIMAMSGFELLGSEAKPAWPTLIQMASSPDASCRIVALDCLDACKPDKEIILPVLLRLLHDSDRVVQKAAAFYFNYDYPQDAEAAGVYKMFPRTREMPTRNTNTNQPPVK